MSIISARFCLNLGAGEQQQLAVLIANMIEDHLRAVSSKHSLPNQQEPYHDNQGVSVLQNRSCRGAYLEGFGRFPQ